MIITYFPNLLESSASQVIIQATSYFGATSKFLIDLQPFSVLNTGHSQARDWPRLWSKFKFLKFVTHNKDSEWSILMILINLYHRLTVSFLSAHNGCYRGSTLVCFFEAAAYWEITIKCKYYRQKLRWTERTALNNTASDELHHGFISWQQLSNLCFLNHNDWLGLGSVN